MSGYLFLSSISLQPAKPHMGLTCIICNLVSVGPGWSVFSSKPSVFSNCFGYNLQYEQAHKFHQHHWIFYRLDKGTSSSFSDSVEHSAQGQLLQRNKIHRSGRSTLPNYSAESTKMYSVMPYSNSAGRAALFSHFTTHH